MTVGRAVAASHDDDVPVTIPRDPARRAAERELSDPAYHQDDPGVVERTLDWVWEKLGDLLASAVDVAPGGVVGLVVVLGAVALMLAALWARFGAPRPAAGGSASGLLPERPRSAVEYREGAAAHAAAGRWSEALRERMRALVRSLEERALIEPRPGRTADEAAAEAGALLPSHASTLAAAAVAFDEVTYAGRTADEAAYARMRDLDDALQRTSPQRRDEGSTR